MIKSYKNIQTVQAIQIIRENHEKIEAWMSRLGYYGINFARDIFIIDGIALDFHEGDWLVRNFNTSLVIISNDDFTHKYKEL
jgi:hypothetical protein